MSDGEEDDEDKHVDEIALGIFSAESSSFVFNDGMVRIILTGAAAVDEGGTCAEENEGATTGALEADDTPEALRDEAISVDAVGSLLLITSSCVDPYGFLHSKQSNVCVGLRARLLVT
jgi:hypothetical protein